MSAAVLYCLLFAGSPSSGCADRVSASEPCDGLCGKLQRHVDYHRRLYYGHYDRHPFDYRFQFDYPWCAGPSQPHWPIAPPGPVYPAGPEVEYEGRRPDKSPRTAVKIGRPVSTDASSLNFNPLRTGSAGK